MARTSCYIVSVMCILITEVICAPSERKHYDDINQAAQASMSLDQIIMNSAQSSGAMDFIVDDNTVLVELDILYDKDEWSDIEKSRIHNGSRKKRNAIHDKRWTNKEIPYIVSNIFATEDKEAVDAAMADYMKYSCVKFREASDADKNKILIQNGAGCSSYVGMTGRGGQSVNLAKGCRVKGVIMHELGHAMGFHHEQTRPDRDDHVTIEKANISPTMFYNFKKYTWEVIKDYSVAYDYHSIMHYGQYAFSTNGQRTIIAKDESYQDKMGNRDGLSFSDIKLVNLMYTCSENCEKKECPSHGYLGKDCQCWCPGNPVIKCPESGLTPTHGSETTLPTTTAESGEQCTDSIYGCDSYAKHGYCELEQHKSYMQERCKKSCGLCSGSTGGTSKDCVDKHSSCLVWKRQGFCQHLSYKTYMADTCPKACGVCDDNTGTDTDTDTKSCSDAHSRCGQWKDNGYCEVSTYASYMKKNCAKTCGHCGTEVGSTVKPTEDPCKDLNTGCPSWGKSGMCDGYYESYMKKYCQKSCQFCKGTASDDSQQDCQDQNLNCQSWAARGECERNPGYMNFYCKKSCGTCGRSDDELMGSSDDCKDLDKYCKAWARRGECKYNPNYMKVNCKKTCTFCSGDNNGNPTTTKSPGTNPGCLDSSSNCEDWAYGGACRKSPRFMRESCKKSCKLC